MKMEINKISGDDIPLPFDLVDLEPCKLVGLCAISGDPGGAPGRLVEAGWFICPF